MDLGIHCNVSSERNNHHPKNKTVLKYLYLVGGGGSSVDGGSVHVTEQHHLPLMKSLFTFSWSSSMMLCFFSYSLFLSLVCPQECLAHAVYPHIHAHTRPLVVMFTVWMSRQTVLLHLNLGKLCFGGATFSHCLQGCSGPTVSVSCTDSFFSATNVSCTKLLQKIN